MTNEGKKTISGFFKGLKEEFFRISFLSKDKAKKQTIAVVISSVIIAIIISILDLLFKYGIDVLVKL